MVGGRGGRDWNFKIDLFLDCLFVCLCFFKFRRVGGKCIISLGRRGGERWWGRVVVGE